MHWYRSFFWDKSDLEDDLRHSVFCITGAESPVARIIGRKLARQGATVIFASSELANADGARRFAKRKSKKDHIYTVSFDPAEKDSISEFVKEIGSQWDRIDGLIHIPQSYYPEYGTNDEGIERTFAANILSTHSLAGHAKKLLKHSQRPRMLVLLSAAATIYPFKYKKLPFSEKKFDPFRAFAVSQRAHWILLPYWGNRLFEAKIPIQGVNLGLHDWPKGYFFGIGVPVLSKLAFRSPREAADTPMWLLRKKDWSIQDSGQMFLDRELLPFEDYSLETETERIGLWRAVSKMREL